MRLDYELRRCGQNNKTVEISRTANITDRTVLQPYSQSGTQYRARGDPFGKFDDGSFRRSSSGPADARSRKTDLSERLLEKPTTAGIRFSRAQPKLTAERVSSTGLGGELYENGVRHDRRKRPPSSVDNLSRAVYALAINAINVISQRLR